MTVRNGCLIWVTGTNVAPMKFMRQDLLKIGGTCRKRGLSWIAPPRPALWCQDTEPHLRAHSLPAVAHLKKHTSGLNSNYPEVAH